jgi:hypothetical protein
MILEEFYLGFQKDSDCFELRDENRSWGAVKKRNDRREENGKERKNKKRKKRLWDKKERWLGKAEVF